MSIVEGAQQRMSAFQAGQASPRELPSGRAELKGRRDGERTGLRFFKKDKWAFPIVGLQAPKSRSALADLWTMARQETFADFRHNLPHKRVFEKTFLKYLHC